MCYKSTNNTKNKREEEAASNTDLLEHTCENLQTQQTKIKQQNREREEIIKFEKNAAPNGNTREEEGRGGEPALNTDLLDYTHV